MIGSLEYFTENSILSKFWRILFGIPFFHAHRVWKDFSMVSFSYGERVLDIGCGDGLLANHIADQYQAYVYGIDRLAQRVKLARKVSSFYRLNCDYKVKDLEKLGFLKDEHLGQFDTLLLMDILEHVNSYQELVRYSVGALRNTSRIIIQTPLPEQNRYLYKNYQDYFAYGKDRHIRVGLRFRDIEELLSNLGFKRVTAVYTNGPLLSTLWECSEIVRKVDLLNYIFMPFFILMIAVIKDGVRVDKIKTEKVRYNNLFAVYERG